MRRRCHDKHPTYRRALRADTLSCEKRSKRLIVRVEIVSFALWSTLAPPSICAELLFSRTTSLPLRWE